MASKKEVLTTILSFPVVCKCQNCNVENNCTIKFSVTGEGIYGGSPFGRKERAQKAAAENLKQNLRYHIKKLYEESEKAPEKFVRYIVEEKCCQCGKMLPWKEIEGSTIADSAKRVNAGLVPSLISLSSKKFKEPKKDVKEALNAIPTEYLPKPAMSEDELVEEKGLTGIDGTNPADMTAFFMH